MTNEQILLKYFKKLPESGIYETEYGNACSYEKGDLNGYDIDMDEEIPFEIIDFTKKIGDI